MEELFSFQCSPLATASPSGPGPGPRAGRERSSGHGGTARPSRGSPSGEPRAGGSRRVLQDTAGPGTSRHTLPTSALTSPWSPSGRSPATPAPLRAAALAPRELPGKSIAGCRCRSEPGHGRLCAADPGRNRREGHLVIFASSKYRPAAVAGFSAVFPNDA